MSTFHIPLQPIEIQARNHALLCSIGFLILLPVGALWARYARTFTNKWFWPHAAFQFLVAAPVIFAGWALGHKTTNDLQQPHFQDAHQRMGLALLVLYLVQLCLGVFVHFVKIPGCGIPQGWRPPQNYFHAILGLAIFALAAGQVHRGLYVEWPMLGGLHPVPQSAKSAWVAVIVIFWVLYTAGLVLLPRQFEQESQARKDNE